jgi:hypothetical protein
VAILSSGLSSRADRPFKPAIPKTWDDAAMATLEVALANPIGSPKHVSADYYYKIPVRPIYKSYPVYAPGHEPPGYMDWLRQEEPKVVWGVDPKTGAKHAPPLLTEADWINAGELVFDAPIAFNEDGVTFLRDARNSEWYRSVQPPLDMEGRLPFYSYVVRERGKVDLGEVACATCHTRVIPDGSTIKGAQGNFPFDRARAFNWRKARFALEQVKDFERALFAAPWLRPDAQASIDQMAVDEIAGCTKRFRRVYWAATAPVRFVRPIYLI